MVLACQMSDELQAHLALVRANIELAVALVRLRSSVELVWAVQIRSQPYETNVRTQTSSYCSMDADSSNVKEIGC